MQRPPTAAPPRLKRPLLQAILWAAVATTALPGQGSNSYFGVTGLSFIPTSTMQAPGTVTLSYSSKPGTQENISLDPYSVQMGYTSKSGKWEVRVTNTYLYANLESGVGAQDALAFPIIPSAKYQLVSYGETEGRTAVAMGFALPYGVFYTYDKHLRLFGTHSTIHTGVATKLTTFHAFSGLSIFFGAEDENYLHSGPIRLHLEGSWGGVTENLKQKEESFFAITTVYRWTDSLNLETWLRFDSEYGLASEVKLPAERNLGIRLAYFIN
ncbi:MAG: hypothetical protein IID15_03950 [Candidatus Marinimicrobia bacterium]|nr:hypothetical protein [Candidatus Neomarinimicrobiota bacterium]